MSVVLQQFSAVLIHDSFFDADDEPGLTFSKLIEILGRILILRKS